MTRVETKTARGAREAAFMVRALPNVEEGLWSELPQFVGSIAAFVVVALLRPRIVYVPGRTLGRWPSRHPR